MTNGAPHAGAWTRRAKWAAGSVIVLWASAFVGMALVLRELTPGQVAFSRTALAALTLWPFVLARRPTMPSGRDLLKLTAASAVGVALYQWALGQGQRTVSAGLASLLVNTVPLWTALLAQAVLGERLGRRGWCGASIAFVGVALVGLHRAGWAGFDHGAGWVLVAAVGQAASFVILRPVLARMRALDVTAATMLIGGLLLAPHAGDLPRALAAATTSTRLWIVFLGVGPSALAFVAWSVVLTDVPAGKAAQSLFLVPALAFTLGALCLGERPSAVTLLGGSLALVGVILTQSSRRPPIPAVGLPDRETCS